MRCGLGWNQAEQNKLESNAGRTTEERSAVDLLRDDAEQAESEAALCRDREQILQLEARGPVVGSMIRR